MTYEAFQPSINTVDIVHRATSHLKSGKYSSRGRDMKCASKTKLLPKPNHDSHARLLILASFSRA